MSVRRRDFLKIAGGAAGFAAVGAAEARPGQRPRKHRRDVCILGGGASGAYAAIHLQDLGASVAVVERSQRLGGHAETYVDPASGAAIDTGVVAFEDVSVVRDYFTRFGVALAPFTGGGGGARTYIDFTTGSAVNYAPPGQAETGAALFKYRQILAQQFPYLEMGFELPDPVPEDLALPFAHFIQKHSLQALFPLAFQYGQGAGDMLGNPAIFTMKLFGAAVLDSLLGGGFVRVPGGVAALYDAIGAELVDDVFYSSRILSVERGCCGGYPIEVFVGTPEGAQVISCKKLVVAYPPSRAGFRPLNLDRSEQEVFRRLRPNHYSTGVVELSGLPASTSLQAVGQSTTYNLPHLPGLYGVTPSAAPGLWNVKFGSPQGLPDRVVKREIVRSLERVADEGAFPIEFQRFAFFRNHTPFHIQASSKDVASGFYERLNALQGHRDTFYTGATFQTNDSSQIWRFTQQLLPRVLA